MKTPDVSASRGSGCFGGSGCETLIIYAVGTLLGVNPPWVAGARKFAMDQSRTAQHYNPRTLFSRTLRLAGWSGHSRMAGTGLGQ